MPLTSITLVTQKFFRSMDRFFPFENQPEVAVAVSGGADSLALSLLLNKWILQKSGKLIALTVDHQLRPDSTAESLKVNNWLKKRGIEHHIIPWIDKKPATDIQNHARAARYRLLEQWCLDHRILHLFLGHHADDQAETVLQRLLHASGSVGLQGIQSCRYRPFGRILRPLLSFTKQELADYLKLEDQPWFSDPSNLNPQFERVRIRSLLPELQRLTRTPLPLNQTAAKCRETNTIVEQVLSDFFTKDIHLSCFGFITITRHVFLACLPALQSLILSHCLQAIGGGTYPFSGKQLQHVLMKIAHRQNITMGGCFIIVKSAEILITREARNLPGAVDIVSHEVYWDNRFFLNVSNDLIGAKIIPQGDNPHIPERLSIIPHHIRKTLPLIIKQNGILIPFGEKTKDISWKLRLKNKLLP